MHLTLVPTPSPFPTRIVVDGDTIFVDGERFDLSTVPEGGAGIPQGEHSFVGWIARQNGTIHATLRVCADDATERAVLGDPARWIIEHTKGTVKFPVAEVGA